MNELLLNLQETSSPPTDPATGLPLEPVSLDEAKLQCRIDAGSTAEDDLVAALVVAARQYCEAETSRAFVQRAFQLRLNRFPFAFPIAYYPFYSLERLPSQLYGMIYVPRPPLVSVASIQYVDADGVLQTLDPSRYQVESNGILQGRITPAYGLLFPATRYQMGAVQVDYTAGYSADASGVPAGIKAAIKMLVAHWYRNREAVAEGSFGPVPMAVDALLAPHKWGAYG